MFSYDNIVSAIDYFKTHTEEVEDDSDADAVLILVTNYGRKLKFQLDLNAQDYGLEFIDKNNWKKNLIAHKVSDKSYLYFNVNDISEICVRRKLESETPADYGIFA